MSETTPTRASGISARNSFANVRARSRRLGSDGARWASIERVMSNTTYTSTPSRPSRRAALDTTGCAHARATRPLTATSSATSNPMLRRRGGASPSCASTIRDRRTVARSAARRRRRRLRRGRRAGSGTRATRRTLSLEPCSAGRCTRTGRRQRRAALAAATRIRSTPAQQLQRELEVVDGIAHSTDRGRPPCGTARSHGARTPAAASSCSGPPRAGGRLASSGRLRAALRSDRSRRVVRARARRRFGG